jgi:Protein of unknwon function (DUF3310)
VGGEARHQVDLLGLNEARTMGNSANDGQVGGDHYKAKIQHWDYVLANEIPYLEAQIIKYLTRWRKKGGHQDLLKARHFMDKLFEFEGVVQTEPRLPLPGTAEIPTVEVRAEAASDGESPSALRRFYEYRRQKRGLARPSCEIGSTDYK